MRRLHFHVSFFYLVLQPRSPDGLLLAVILFLLHSILHDRHRYPVSMRWETGPSVRSPKFDVEGCFSCPGFLVPLYQTGAGCRMWARVCSSSPHSHESVSQSPVLFSFLKTTMSCSPVEYYALFSPAQLVGVVLLRFLSILASKPVCFECLLQQHLGFVVWGVGVRLWKSATSFCRSAHLLCVGASTSRVANRGTLPAFPDRVMPVA